MTPRTQTTGADKVATVARDIAQAPVTGATTPVTSTNGPVVPGQTSTTGARVSQPVVDAGVKTNASTPASLTNPTGAATPAAIGTPSTPASLTNPTGAPVGRSGVDTGVTPRTQTTGADKVATVARDIAQAPVTGATTPVTSTNGPVVPGQTSTTGARVSQPVVDAGVKTNASTPASLTNPTGAATPAAIGTPSTPASLTNPTGAPVGRSGVDTGVTPRTQTTGADKVATVARDIAQAPVTGATTPVTSTNGPVVPGQTSTTGARVSQPVVDAGVKTNASTPASLTNPTGAATPAAIGTPSTPASLTNPTGAPVGRSGVDTGVTPRTQTTGADKVATVARDIAQAPVTGATTPVTSTNGPVVPGQTSTTGARVSQPVVDAGVKTNASTPASLTNPTGAATPAAIGTPSTPASLTNPTGAPVGRSGVDTGVTPRTQTTGADKVATVARDIAQAPVTGATTPVTSTNGPVVPGQTSTTGARVSQPVVDAGVKTNASTPASLTNPTGAATPAAIGTPSTPASLTNPTGAPVGRSGVDTGVTPRTQTTGADKVATVARDIAQAPVTGATTPVTSTNGPVVPGQTSTTGARVSQPVVDAGVKTNASTPASLTNPTGAATPAAIGTPSTPASLTNPTGAPVGRSGVDTGVTPRTQTTGADKVATVARDIAIETSVPGRTPSGVETSQTSVRVRRMELSLRLPRTRLPVHYQDLTPLLFSSRLHPRISSPARRNRPILAIKIAKSAKSSSDPRVRWTSPVLRTSFRLKDRSTRIRLVGTGSSRSRILKVAASRKTESGRSARMLRSRRTVRPERRPASNPIAARRRARA